jgi:predicted secreted protein
MAQPTVLPGTKLLILVGDGAVPEVFGQPCGLVSRGVAFTASTNSTLIPDCDDPELPAWEAKDVNSISCQVTGNGVMATESFNVWNDWFQSALARNCQIHLDGNGLGYWEGQFILTNLRYGGQRGQKVRLDITLDNTGAVPWVTVP